MLTAIRKYFHKLREKREFSRLPMQAVFTKIYRTNKWSGKESVSGKGSTLRQTGKIREAIPGLLQDLEIRSMLDLPCGDFHWMKEVDLGGVDYIGADIVSELIATVASTYGNERRRFLCMDLTTAELPPVDLLLCRDCWVHLGFEDIASALANIKRSGIQYLLTTTFTRHRRNTGKVRGKFRPLNLQLPPFNFPEPQALIMEDNLDSRHSASGKSLGLWRVADLPEPE